MDDAGELREQRNQLIERRAGQVGTVDDGLRLGGKVAADIGARQPELRGIVEQLGRFIDQGGDLVEIAFPQGVVDLAGKNPW